MFLIPAVIVVIALGKLIGALRAMTKALSPFFGVDSLVGGLVLDLFAFTVTVLLCFVQDHLQNARPQDACGND